MTTVADCAIPPDTALPRTEVASASLELRAAPPAARQARIFTRQCLRLWEEDEELIDAAVLIVCELATNAVRHGPAATITLRLALQPDALLIEVHDGSAVLPVQRVAGQGEDCGRGLLIIATLAESWTSDRDPDGGKWVRARLLRATTALIDANMPHTAGGDTA